MDFAGAYSPDHLKFMLEGFLFTLKIAGISIVLSFIFAAIIGVIRYTKIPVISQVVGLAVEVIRNLPLLLLILFTYFGLPEVGIPMTATKAAIIALVVFESAMISEVIRSGLNSIDKGQLEAGRSSGLSYIQTLWHIVLPQALRRMVPPIVSQFISLLKDTSLAVVISLPELMHNTQVIAAQKMAYLVPIFILAALMYWVVNFSLSVLARRLELKTS
ncbi:MAG: amino acid ABC transporter permease [Bacillaceae bacterium]